MGDSVTEPKEAGIYRLDSEAARLSVYRGKAEVSLAGNKATVKSGNSTALSGALKTAIFDVHKKDLLQEDPFLRARLLFSKKIREKRFNEVGRLGIAAEDPLAMPEGVMDRLEQERLYQDMQNMQQTRPAAAGPHPQPWEPQPQQ